MSLDFGDQALETQWGSGKSGAKSSYYYIGYGKRHLPPPIDLDEALRPLIDQLKRYDRDRRLLEQVGGRPYHLKQIAQILGEEIVVKGRSGSVKVALTDQASLRSALSDMGTYNLHLDVRQLETLMPVYYICRISRDYLYEYDLIIEDLYRSPGYPMADKRFVRLMHAGHELLFLRLSQFRNKVSDKYSSSDPQKLRFRVDTFLHKLGSHVFQAAWHEDQRTAVATADHFGFPNLHNAIELLYLCLSGELCELRGSVTGEMLRFFIEVYPQPAIRAFLEMLTRLDGEALADLPQKALQLYTRLSSAFGAFLRAEVKWGYPSLQVPLYKLILGNFSRLHFVGEELKGNDAVKRAGESLERESREVIEELLTWQIRS